MSNYIKATNFATKDSLATGNPNKIIKGTEIDTEFNAIASAVSSKADINSPTFTGIPEAPTATAGTNTTQVATAAFVIAERTNTSTLTNKTLTSPTINTPTISGGSISGITDLAVADGGTGASTLAANNVLLGNGTSALQVVAPNTSGNFLRSNGTTWVSEAVTLASGTVSSVATGNGLQGGTITSTGTLSITAPSYQSIGSYASFTNQNANPTLTPNTNYSGTQCTTIGQDSAGNPTVVGTAPGTWRMLGLTTSANSYWLGVRVS
jgi:hypothetical protein